MLAVWLSLVGLSSLFAQDIEDLLNGNGPSECPRAIEWRHNSTQFETETRLVCAVFYPDAECTESPFLLPRGITVERNVSEMYATQVRYVFLLEND